MSGEGAGVYGVAVLGWAVAREGCAIAAGAGMPDLLPEAAAAPSTREHGNQRLP